MREYACPLIRDLKNLTRTKHGDKQVEILMGTKDFWSQYFVVVYSYQMFKETMENLITNFFCQSAIPSHIEDSPKINIVISKLGSKSENQS